MSTHAGLREAGQRHRAAPVLQRPAGPGVERVQEEGGADDVDDPTAVHFGVGHALAVALAHPAVEAGGVRLAVRPERLAGGRVDGDDVAALAGERCRGRRRRRSGVERDTPSREDPKLSPRQTQATLEILEVVGGDLLEARVGGCARRPRRCSATRRPASRPPARRPARESTAGRRQRRRRQRPRREDRTGAGRPGGEQCGFSWSSVAPHQACRRVPFASAPKRLGWLGASAHPPRSTDLAPQNSARCVLRRKLPAACGTDGHDTPLDAASLRRNALPFRAAGRGIVGTRITCAGRGYGAATISSPRSADRLVGRVRLPSRISVELQQVRYDPRVLRGGEAPPDPLPASGSRWCRTGRRRSGRPTVSRNRPPENSPVSWQAEHTRRKTSPLPATPAPR